MSSADLHSRCLTQIRIAVDGLPFILRELRELAPIQSSYLKNEVTQGGLEFEIRHPWRGQVVLSITHVAGDAFAIAMEDLTESKFCFYSTRREIQHVRSELLRYMAMLNQEAADRTQMAKRFPSKP